MNLYVACCSTIVSGIAGLEHSSKEDAMPIELALIMLALNLLGLRAIYKKNKPTIAILKNKFYTTKRICFGKKKVLFDPEQVYEGIYNIEFGQGFVKVPKSVFETADRGDACYFIYSELEPKKTETNVFS